MSEDSRHEPSTLETAWLRFATYDHNANEVQQRFFRLRNAILVVGVAATVLAIVYSQYIAGTLPPGQDEARIRPAMTEWQFYVWLPMIAMPILSSILSAGASKLARGVDWINLRGAAESIKREIYRYRCRVGAYARGPRPRDAALADAVGQVTARLMGTEVLNASMSPYRQPKLPPAGGVCERDDGFSDLSPAQYLDYRLADQLAYYRQQSRQLDRRHRRFQWWVSILGGVGTLLAALGQEIWVPASVAVATALVAYLELRNVETNLASYNRAALGLDNIATWWSGLSDGAKADAASFAALVDRTETLLGSENAAWMQEMEEAVARAEEEEKE